MEILSNFKLVLRFWAVYIALFLCGMLYGMSTETWATMPKSGENSETIEQAIERFISAHNDDSTAHMEPGQSIDEHRKESIIDHPAGSIVSDKLGAGDYYEYQGQLPAFNWSVEEGAANSIAGRHITMSLFSQTEFIALNNLEHKAGAAYPERDLMYKFILNINGLQNSNGVLQFGLAGDTLDDPYAILFEKNGTAFRLRIRYNNSDVLTQAITIANNTDTFFRIYYERVSGKIIFYQGTTVLAEYIPLDMWRLIFGQMHIYAMRSTNTSIFISVKGWQCAYSVPLD